MKIGFSYPCNKMPEGEKRGRKTTKKKRASKKYGKEVGKTSFCVACKKFTKMEDMTKRKLSNGRRLACGKCSNCGKKKCRFLRNKDE